MFACVHAHAHTTRTRIRTQINTHTPHNTKILIDLSSARNVDNVCSADKTVHLDYHICITVCFNCSVDKTNITSLRISLWRDVAPARTIREEECSDVSPSWNFTFLEGCKMRNEWGERREREKERCWPLCIIKPSSSFVPKANTWQSTSIRLRQW